MLKAKCDRGETEITMKGTLPELCADALTIIHAVHSDMAEDDMLSAEVFKQMIIGSIDKAFYDEEDWDNEFNKERV